MDAKITDFLGTPAGTSAQQAKLTPTQALDCLVKFFENTDDAARSALADLLPILARNPGNTRLIAATKVWFVPIDRKQAQVFKLPVVKRRATGKEPRAA